MPRAARAAVGDQCYYVLNRGNACRRIFFKDAEHAPPIVRPRPPAHREPARRTPAGHWSVWRTVRLTRAARAAVERLAKRAGP